ncbi:M4 family metallopeptidase [Alteribacter populi]|uniref:M4 family metallopeptidase n=1 Tax=Alteribacter populi TaxID=2011011 RepID=UPI000BBA68B8|nr:M4 family metallopeptidase [Alteribacter populi]
MLKKSVVSAMAALLLVTPFTSYAASDDRVMEQDSEQSRVLYTAKGDSEKLFTTSGAELTKMQQATSFLSQHQEIFNINNPNESLQLDSEKTDDLGMTHIRFQQVKNDIPVEGHEVIVHFDEQESVKSVNGHYHKDVETLKLPTRPQLVEREAVDAAKVAVEAPEELEDPPSAELVYYPIGESVELAYKINLNYFAEEPGNWFVYVDAISGDILDQYNTIHNLAEAAGLKGSNIGAGNEALAIESEVFANPDELNPEDYQSASGAGVGVHGEDRVIKISHKAAEDRGRLFQLFDFSRPDLDGILTYDFQNQWRSDDFDLPGVAFSKRKAAFKDEYDAPAVDAHYNSTKVYEYFLEEHGRNSIDDDGMSIVSSVHYGDNYANAFWNGSQMTYGDGDGEFFIPLSAGLDVAAHEIAHGVTTHTAGLVYRDQSGAVNESISDIFGVLVDTESWDIGDNVMAPPAIESGRTALRSLEEPGKFPVNEAYWDYGDGSYPAHMDEYYDLPINLDNGGVHVNSSIINHAAFLIGDEIGREKLGQIVYRALTVYLTPLSDFQDTRFAFIQAAEDIYGDDSEEAAVTKAGFDGVGIYEEE